MSPYTSSHDEDQRSRSMTLAHSLDRVIQTLRSHFPAMSGELENIASQLSNDYHMSVNTAQDMLLNGRGPRGTILRAAFGEEAQERIQAGLPKVRTDTSSEEYRNRIRELSLGAFIDRQLSQVKLGDLNGYHRWDFNKGESFGSLVHRYGSNSEQVTVSSAISMSTSPSNLPKEGIYRGRLGEGYHYGGSDQHSLLLHYIPTDGGQDITLVYIGSVHGGIKYCTYVPLEETWVLHDSPKYIVESELIERAKALLEANGLLTAELTLAAVAEQVYEAAVAEDLLSELTTSWPTPTTGYDPNRKWESQGLFNYAVVPIQQKWISEAVLGKNEFLQLKIGNDVFTIMRQTNFREGADNEVRYTFNCATQSLLRGWEGLPARIRRQIVDEYMGAVTRAGESLREMARVAVEVLSSPDTAPAPAEA